MSGFFWYGGAAETPGDAGGAQTAILGDAGAVVVYAPAVTVARGSVARAVGSGPVILHAPRPQVMQSVTFDQDVPTEQVSSTTSSQGDAGGVVVHAPLPTVAGVASTRAVSAAPVVVHAPAVTTSVSGISRSIVASHIIVAAPPVTTAAGAITRAVGAGPVVVHAPATRTAAGAVTRAVSAGHVIVHAPPLARVVVGSPQTAILGDAGALILHAPLPTAYTLRTPAPPLLAQADNLYTDVTLY